MSPGLERHLEALYAHYNHREFVHPDPLELVYPYENMHDREIAGMIASSLAFGRVSQILENARAVLARMEKPRQFLERVTRPQLETIFKGFRHRFVTCRELVDLLYAIKMVAERWGTLEAAFAEAYLETEETTVEALQRFVTVLREAASSERNFLLPQPQHGSACKRLHLLLRWMVRRDEVDPGGWDRIPARALVCPLDTHMYRIGCGLGFTRRKQPDGRCALEITRAFREISPEDPVRYDFALTRLGIRQDGDMNAFLRTCSAKFIGLSGC